MKTPPKIQKLAHANLEGHEVRAQFKEELDYFLKGFVERKISSEDMADVLDAKAQELRAIKLRIERAKREERYKKNTQVPTQTPTQIPIIIPPTIVPPKPTFPNKSRKQIEERHAIPSVTNTDAPLCSDCGSIMVPNGSCYKCTNCGSTSGCS